MDRVELKNLLLHPKLDPNVLEPLGYHKDTFKQIYAIVDEAFKVERKQSSKRLKEEVRKLRSLNGDRESYKND